MNCSITELTIAKTEPMVKFLPLVLDKLIGLIVEPPLLNGQVLNCAHTTFEALATIVKTLTVNAHQPFPRLLNFLVTLITFCSILFGFVLYFYENISQLNFGLINLVSSYSDKFSVNRINEPHAFPLVLGTH